MDQTKLTRREREKIRSKEEILAAALHLFSQKGFHNVSMQEIADKAEFGVGTLYNFFDSKEALFEELLDNCGQSILIDFLDILNGQGNAAQRLGTFIRQQPQFQQKYGETIKLYISIIELRPGLSKNKKREASREKIKSVLVDVIGEGIEQRLFRPVDPEITALSLLTTLETIIFDMPDILTSDKAAKTYEKVEQLFLAGLLKPHVTHDESLTMT